VTKLVLANHFLVRLNGCARRACHLVSDSDWRGLRSLPELAAATNGEEVRRLGRQLDAQASRPRAPARRDDGTS